MGSTWAGTIPAGVIKLHSLSAKIREQAVANAVVLPFLDTEPGFGKKKGESHSITRLSTVAEPANARLSENQRVPIDNFTVNVNTITISEWGRGVSFSSYEEDLAFFDLRNRVQKALLNQQTLALDTGGAVALKATLIKAWLISGQELSGTYINTAGTFGAASTRNLKATDLDFIQDYMYDTLLVPERAEGGYVGIFRTLAIRGVMNEVPSATTTVWSDWHKYTDPQAKYNNEIGRYSDIRIVKSNHSNAFANVGTSSVLGEGVIFGDDAAVMVEAMTPELKTEESDFGRERAVAWIGELEFGHVWPTGNAGEAKAVHIGSA